MAIQRKVGTSLNDARQRKLAEIVDAEPFATTSSVLAAALDVMYRAWREAGRDLTRTGRGAVSVAAPIATHPPAKATEALVTPPFPTSPDCRCPRRNSDVLRLR